MLRFAGPMWMIYAKTFAGKPLSLLHMHPEHAAFRDRVVCEVDL